MFLLSLKRSRVKSSFRRNILDRYLCDATDGRDKFRCHFCHPLNEIYGKKTADRFLRTRCLFRTALRHGALKALNSSIARIDFVRYF